MQQVKVFYAQNGLIVEEVEDTTLEEAMNRWLKSMGDTIEFTQPPLLTSSGRIDHNVTLVIFYKKK